MTTTSDKILQSIKDKHISPAPRWMFLAKNSVFWVMFAAALLIGALSFAFIADMTVNHDWNVYQYLHKTFFQYVLLSLPYLWIVCLVAFFWIAYYNFVHTKGWYHHRVYMVVLAAFGMSVGLGSVLFYFGIGGKIDQVLSENVPYYESLNYAAEQQMWNNPDEGLLSGKVLEVIGDDTDTFTVEDANGDDWIVNKSDAQIESSSEVTVGEKVKMVGEREDNQKFVASEIRDWHTNRIKKRRSDDDSRERGSVRGEEDKKQQKDSDERRSDDEDGEDDDDDDEKDD